MRMCWAGGAACIATPAAGSFQMLLSHRTDAAADSLRDGLQDGEGNYIDIKFFGELTGCDRRR